MPAMLAFIRVAATVFGVLLTLMSLLTQFRFRWSKGGPILWPLKSYANALSPFLSAAGVICAVAGALSGCPAAIVLGGYSAIVFFIYFYRISALPDPESGFEKSFGPTWQAGIPDAVKTRFLLAPAALRLPDSAHYTFEQNVPFATIPDSGRQLLCDMWLPAGTVAPSGLAFIYLHGSAWYLLDKDLGTRTFFRHLAAQGHVVMDVAYRLFPEADMTGMIQDAKRAIAWMKGNASRYGVDPGKVIIGGGSAGGHIALMAAYLPEEGRLTPPGLLAADLSVKAVLATYGPPDVAALYYHTDQQVTTRAMPEKHNMGSAPTPSWLRRMMGRDFFRLGINKIPIGLGEILGCHPDECPEKYAYYSPKSHVSSSCPPTLLIHGEHDMFTPVAATRRFYHELRKAGVPVVLHILPQTDHAFDLFAPRLSAVAHSAFYFVERFLAIMAFAKPDDRGRDAINPKDYQAALG